MKLTPTFFSKNGKTGFSYDFGICPMMKTINGKLHSLCGVEKCYAKSLLNGFRGSKLKNKLTNIRDYTPFLKAEVGVINKIPDEIVKMVRGFSFADYIPEFHEEFMYIVKNLQKRHDIISKVIWMKILSGKFPINDFTTICEKANLSLGFTRQTYPLFSEFVVKYWDYDFSIGYTYETLEDLLWLKRENVFLFNSVDTFHDSYIHHKVTRLEKESNLKLFNERIESIKMISVPASEKICNIYGPSREIKKCPECCGCKKAAR